MVTALGVGLAASLIGGGVRAFSSVGRRAPAASPPPRPTAKKVAPVLKPAGNAPLSSLRQGEAGGYLLRAVRDRTHEPIEWVDVVVGQLVVSMARDAVRARAGSIPLRLPVSYADTVEACRLLGCVAPTKEIVDAAYADSNKAGQLVFNGLVRTPADYKRMMSLDFAVTFSTGIDRQLERKPRSGMAAGAWKYWIVHPRLVEKGAVNYGGFDASGKPIQTVGGKHIPTHYDYSQLLQPVRRQARTVSGSPVDLVEHYIALGLPRAFVERFR